MRWFASNVGEPPTLHRLSALRRFQFKTLTKAIWCCAKWLLNTQRRGSLKKQLGHFQAASTQAKKHPVHPECFLFTTP